MKKIALYENSSKPEAISWAEFTANKLVESGIECCAKPELISTFSFDSCDKVKSLPAEDFDKFADIVISFGGDGTMLAAAKALINTNIPIMGVNVGKLGFLAEFSIKNLSKSLEDLLNGDYRVLDRSILETTINGETIYAFNDFVIEKRNSSRMITVQTYSNGNYIGDYRADGLILTSPTGSTAYSLSCGGPIIAPGTNVVCLTPISPHSLTLRPLVIPDSSEVELKVHSPTGDASLVADGHFEKILNNNESIIVKKSEAKIKLIKPLKHSYFDLIRTKLLWAAKPPSFKDDISEL